MPYRYDAASSARRIAEPPKRADAGLVDRGAVPA